MPVQQETKSVLFKNVGTAFNAELKKANAPTTLKAAGELWDNVFNEQCKGLKIDANDRNPIKAELMFITLKNQQLTSAISANTPPPLPEILPQVEDEDEDEDEYINFWVNRSVEWNKSEFDEVDLKFVSPLLDPEKQLEYVKANQAEKIKLQNVQKFVKQYISEIKNKLAKVEDKKEKTFWKNEIKVLEKLNKNLNNPKSDASKQMLLPKEPEDDNDNAIINEIKKEIDIDIENAEESGLNANNLVLDPETLENSVLEHFLLTPEKKPDDAHPKTIYKRSANPAPVPKVGAALLLSRIAGTPKKAPLPEKHLKRSIQKDLEKMRDIYIKEIKDLKLTTEDEKEDRKEVLKTLSNLDLKSKSALTDYNKSDITFENSISQFILNKADLDNIMTSEQQSSLAEKASRKFSEAFAPEAHKKIIQKTNAYTEKLEKELTNLNKSIANHTENAQGSKLKKQNAEVARQKMIEKNIKKLKKLSKDLADNDPSKMKREVLKLYSKKNNKDTTLINLLEETLKVSDPLYEEIKKLDKYIIDLTKDIAKNPPKENENFNKKSNRVEKLAIAQRVRKMAINPPKGTIEDAEGAADNLLINALKEAREANKENTKALIGKGKLDGIIGDILTKIQPEQKKKSKPK